MALDFLEGMDKLCKQGYKKYFTLNLRLSDEVKGARWDQNFIEKELQEHKGEISRIWVCGPPRMNEEFDRSLEKIAPKLGLTKHEYEIM